MNKHHGRGKHHETIYRACPHCHEEFEPSHGAQKFCSHRCRLASFFEKTTAVAKAREEAAETTGQG